MKISLLTACPIVPDAPNIRKDDFDTMSFKSFERLFRSVVNNSSSPN